MSYLDDNQEFLSLHPLYPTSFFKEFAYLSINYRKCGNLLINSAMPVSLAIWMPPNIWEG